MFLALDLPNQRVLAASSAGAANLGLRGEGERRVGGVSLPKGNCRLINTLHLAEEVDFEAGEGSQAQELMTFASCTNSDFCSHKHTCLFMCYFGSFFSLKTVLHSGKKKTRKKYSLAINTEYEYEKKTVQLFPQLSHCCEAHKQLTKQKGFRANHLI